MRHRMEGMVNPYHAKLEREEQGGKDALAMHLFMKLAGSRTFAWLERLHGLWYSLGRRPRTRSWR